MTKHVVHGSRWIIAVVLSFSILTPAEAGPIEDLPPGHWYEVPNSAMIAVAPRPAPPGAEGPEAVVTSASGGALDTKRDRLIVWGGGHSAYSGNEVYAFDLNTLKWQRLTDPSKDVGGYERSGYYPDGQPRCRHTYDFVEYLPPPVDRFCSFGIAGVYRSGQGRYGNVDCLNFETLKWERRANAISYGIGAMAAVDSVTGHVWMHGAENAGYLTEYDPKKDQWTPHGRSGIEAGAISFEPTAEIDPIHRKFVAIGSGRVLVWDINDSGSVRAKELKTKGDTGVLFDKSPGFVFDPVIKKFVAWSGGGNVYTFDLATEKWTKIPPAPDNKVVPGLPTKRGTFGRFRYSPSKNVYVVVSDVYENVYIYRMPKLTAK